MASAVAAFPAPTGAFGRNRPRPSPAPAPMAFSRGGAPASSSASSARRRPTCSIPAAAAGVAAPAAAPAAPLPAARCDVVVRRHRDALFAASSSPSPAPSARSTTSTSTSTRPSTAASTTSTASAHSTPSLPFRRLVVAKSHPQLVRHRTPPSHPQLVRHRTPPSPPKSPPPPKKRNASAPASVADKMAAAAKSFFHGISQGHHPHLPRSSAASSKADKTALHNDPDFQRRKQEEKHFLASWEGCSRSASSASSLAARRPTDGKQLGCSSKSLERNDFKLIKTIGTGTFARVWLAKLAQPDAGDEDKVFALKILKKADVIKLKQIEHVRNERNVLAAVAGHPFITTMVASFQDADNLYMILDYCPGGEVFTYLRNSKTFDEDTARFYAAEICLILEFLHEKEGIAYRDLKPENILIDADGHIKLVDFGFAKKLQGRTTWTLCGTPEYLAPETIRNTGHGPAVDWWAFGILIYEFLASRPPFWDNNPMKIYEQIVEGRLSFPSKGFSDDAKDLIHRLCEVDPSKRLGNLQAGAKDIKAHPFFKGVDWDRLYRREMQGPIVPHLRSHDDTRNFEDYDLEPERKTVYSPDQRKKYDSMFECF